MTLPYRNNLKC